MRRAAAFTAVLASFCCAAAGCAPAARIRIDSLDIPVLAGTTLMHDCPSALATEGQTTVCVSAPAADELRVFNGYWRLVEGDGWKSDGGGGIAAWFVKNDKRLTVGLLPPEPENSKTMIVAFVIEKGPNPL